jgi:hypothetical protein
MKRRQYYQRPVKRHYGGVLRGLAHNQLFSQRGLRGTTLGPANRGRRLDPVAAAVPHEQVAAPRRCQGDGSLGYPLFDRIWRSRMDVPKAAPAEPSRLLGTAPWPRW